jgi:aspartyl protease family protein
MAQSGTALFGVALGTFVLIVLLPHKEAEQASRSPSIAQAGTATSVPTPAGTAAAPAPSPTFTYGPPPSAPLVNVADGYVSIQRAPDSHFYVDGEVNSTTVHFLIDTGATAVVLAPADAQRVGISGNDFSVTASTAGGDVQLMPTTVSRLGVGPLVANDVPLLVARDKLGISLLGQSYLSRIGSVSIAGDIMTLR